MAGLAEALAVAGQLSQLVGLVPGILTLEGVVLLTQDLVGVAQASTLLMAMLKQAQALQAWSFLPTPYLVQLVNTSPPSAPLAQLAPTLQEAPPAPPAPPTRARSSPARGRAAP